MDPMWRICPRRIIPWDDFPAKQEQIWDLLSASTMFSSNAAFPSQYQLEYVKSRLKPIGSEIGLRDFQRNVVENAVKSLIAAVPEDPVLRITLGMRGTAHRKARGKGNLADQFYIYRKPD
ncbi:hypothetical protein B0T26DRAFT_669359 [Lasiosphaeria miniovina]|uniref:Uncharacterized protein n=1 Tax=Lasiosphaeria miniovina TaxID=1954250 RepID=A0AA40ED00_9PEZI|nr:uncharacterized protein B0T26DRAFT_669359 [Lasiosphaeria miniovina]KAK0732891.1 hypothetical protein B0T26DRAFT_669359 [Lasiosphaeria miniovina]